MLYSRVVNSICLIVKKIIFPILTAVFAAILSACGGRDAFRQFDGSAWHTTFHIVYGADGGATPDLSDSIMAVLDRVERSVSVFNDNSLVSRVNGSGEEVEVDSLFIKVFEAAREVNRRSRGAFDPTLAPLIDLWGFGKVKLADGVEPLQADIDSALGRVGLAQCRVENGKVVKKHSATCFNFSALAKGFGCDEVGRMLRRNGVGNYMVEIGGEISVAGHSPRGGDWQLVVDAPVECDSAVVHSAMAMLSVTDCGVATSGNYRNYRDVDGKRVGHTISAVTGRPFVNSTVSATVVAPDAMMADAYATACMAMQPDSAARMVDGASGVSAMLVVADSAGVLTIKKIGSFPAHGLD